MERIYSQAASLCLLADKDLLSGREGTFNLLDGRSHRLSRVCRSSYAAETYSLEEGVDSAEVVRGLIAECKGADLAVCRHDLSVIDSVPLVAVVDAKDTHDRCKSDTSSHGAQKSLCFSVVFLKTFFRRKGTDLRWVETENMLSDALTKDMDRSWLKRVLCSGRWAITFHPEMVRPKPKKTKQPVSSALAVLRCSADHRALLDGMRSMKWPLSAARVNVLPQGASSILTTTFGVLNDYARGPTLSRHSRKNLPLVRQLVQWTKSRFPGFPFTSIQLNNGYASAMHVDGNNEGPSIILALGEFKGGQVWAYDPSGLEMREVTRKLRGFPDVQIGEKLPGKIISIHNKPFKFDGTLPHATESFEGERYSLVFFVHRSWRRAAPAVVRELRDLGFPVPKSS